VGREGREEGGRKRRGGGERHVHTITIRMRERESERDRGRESVRDRGRESVTKNVRVCERELLLRERAPWAWADPKKWESE
jgi:hypothetical protein